MHYDAEVFVTEASSASNLLSEWPFFEHVCVINLESRIDRWEAMQRQFKRLNIHTAQRFAAIRPAENVVENAALQPLRSFLRRIDGDSERSDAKLRATWGCMLSHLGVIRLAQERGWSYVLVLEDDCEFEPYALSVMQRVARQLAGRQWDMLYLGGTFKRGGLRSRCSENLELASRIRLGHAYLVNARLYDRILNEAQVSGLPIDWYYSEILQPQVACFRVSPTLAYQRLLDMSDIESTERKPRFKTRQMLARLWCRVRYGFFSG